MTVELCIEVAATELARALHVSTRKVDHWCRMGYLHPLISDVGSGATRLWTTAGIRHALITGHLVRVLHIEPRYAALFADDAWDAGDDYTVVIDGTVIAGPVPVFRPEIDDEGEL